MPNPALSDQLALQQLFQEPMQPLNTYSQGALAIAMADRARREQAQRDIQQSAMVMARQKEIEKMRLDSEERAIDIHSKARIAEAKAEYDMKSEAAKKERRDEALAEARAMGIGPDRLPDGADYPTILEAVTKSRGRQLVAAAKSAASAINAYAQFHGETADAVAKRAIAKAIGGLSPKELKDAKITQDDINRVLQDPSKLTDIMVKAAKEKNTKASAILNRLNAEYQQDIETGMAAAEKANPRLTGLAERFKAASDDLKSLRTKGGYDEASGIESSKALVTDAFSPQQQAAQKPPPPPPPPPPPSSVAAARGAAPQFQGLFPMAGSAARSVGSAIAGAAQPAIAAGGAIAQDVGTLFGGGDWANPFSAARGAAAPSADLSLSSGGPAVPYAPTGAPAVIPPSELARRKLLQQIQESNAYNSLLFPQQTNPSLFQP